MAPKPRAQRGQSFLPLRRNESSTISSLRSLDKPPTADRCRTERKACAQSPKRKTRPDERKRVRAPLLQIPGGDPGGRESSPAASTEGAASAGTRPAGACAFSSADVGADPGRRWRFWRTVSPSDGGLLSGRALASGGWGPLEL